MLLVLDADDVRFPLPCGCTVHRLKVFEGGKQLTGVYRVEVTRASPLEKAHGQGPRWTICQLALNDNGQPVVHNGEVLRTERQTRKPVELRCKHHPEYGS